MNPLVITEDGSGRVGIGLRQPGSVDYLKLVADTGVTLVVPTGTNHVLMSCSTNFFASYTYTALTTAVYDASSVESSGVCGQDAAEQNPEFRSLASVTGMSFIAKAAGDLTLSWYG